jgi:hypothetical protein
MIALILSLIEEMMGSKTGRLVGAAAICLVFLALAFLTVSYRSYERGIEEAQQRELAIRARDAQTAKEVTDEVLRLDPGDVDRRLGKWMRDGAR